jgi:hypothetical protein
MTLEEKMYFDCTLNTTKDAKRKAKIAEDFAIGFAEWCAVRDYLHINKELLKIYKKEKGL